MPAPLYQTSEGLANTSDLTTVEPQSYMHLVTVFKKSSYHTMVLEYCNKFIIMNDFIVMS